MAVSTSSLGYKGYYKDPYLDLGLTMLEVTARSYQESDKKKEADQIYAKTFKRQKKRVMRKLKERTKLG